MKRQTVTGGYLKQVTLEKAEVGDLLGFECLLHPFDEILRDGGGCGLR
jgi:hypothetical protein